MSKHKVHCDPIFPAEGCRIARGEGLGTATVHEIKVSGMPFTVSAISSTCDWPISILCGIFAKGVIIQTTLNATPFPALTLVQGEGDAKWRLDNGSDPAWWECWSSNLEEGSRWFLMSTRNRMLALLQVDVGVAYIEMTMHGFKCSPSESVDMWWKSGHNSVSFPE